MDVIDVHREREDTVSQKSVESPTSDKKNADIEIEAVDSNDFKDSSDEKIFLPEENDIVIDPRLKDYPIPLVAKTVDLHNDPTWVHNEVKPSVMLILMISLQWANSYVPLLVLLYILGGYRMWSIFVLLLQALLHESDELCRATAFMGYGCCDG